MTGISAAAIDLDALADTRPLWEDWLRAAASVLGINPAAIPSDRGKAAAILDQGPAGNWRTLLERFSEERAAAYLRRDASASAALRSLAAGGWTLGIFTDAPEPLARVALAQLGAERRVEALETGAGAEERLRGRLGGDVVVVSTRDELQALAERS
jgi:phosphoglycolate phosphatase-like HAD superfamily hydrolase